jgi:hypothetical protein
VHQIDCSIQHCRTCRAFTFGESLGVVVWLYQKQTLDQQLVQVLHREPVPEDAVDLPASRARI